MTPNVSDGYRAGELPTGLYFCADCGEVRGQTKVIDDFGEKAEWKSTCLCEGLKCSSCGRRAIRRPISDYFDPEDGEWWHEPHFMGMVRECRECRAAE